MVEFEEKNLRKCKKCQNLKPRIASGKFPNGKDTRFVDEKNKQWSGSVCPDCVREAARVRAQKSRDKTGETQES